MSSHADDRRASDSVSTFGSCPDSPFVCAAERFCGHPAGETSSPCGKEVLSLCDETTHAEIEQPGEDGLSLCEKETSSEAEKPAWLASEQSEKETSSPAERLRPCERRRGNCPVHGRLFSETEVAACSAEPGSGGKCLVVFENCVYDLSRFSHPGGAHLLKGFAGKDVTTAFYEAGHSVHALKLLASLCVGIVEERAERHRREVGERCLCDRAEATRETRHRRLRKGQAARLAASGEEVEASKLPSSHATHAADELIQFAQPLLPQIWRLTKEEYERLIETPCMKEGVLRLMPYSWMEPLSKTHWWMIPLLWLPLVCWWIRENLKVFSTTLCIASLLVGFASWSLIEYLMHRFLFHFPESELPDLRVVRVVHFLLHAVHHFLPLDPLRLVVPPALFVALASGVYAFFSLFLPQWSVRAGWPGGMLGYIAYDLIHYSTHHAAVLDCVSHIREMRKYHMRHHYRHPLLGFGVTTKIWDRVFGTLPPCDEVTQPPARREPRKP
ncbi:UNVERIFIED_CONTAM: cytochrome b5 family heme/steroid binding domain-containing protein [Hammondia hammondi]|eukprot:XP_008887832.1 cytochrome b5 family heme/steroid binding domain-containing protein [Hammondia hammondi]